MRPGCRGGDRAGSSIDDRSGALHVGRDEHDRRADDHAQSRAARRRRPPRPPRPLLPDDRADREPTRPRQPGDRRDHDRHPTPTLDRVRPTDEGQPESIRSTRSVGGSSTIEHIDHDHASIRDCSYATTVAIGGRWLALWAPTTARPRHRAPCRARRRTAGVSRTGSPEGTNRATPESRGALVTVIALGGTPRSSQRRTGLQHSAVITGDASSGPGGLEVDAGADAGPGGGGPSETVVRGPAHDPCTYRSLSAHDLLAWHVAYAYQGNDDPPVPPPDAYYGSDPSVRWALAHCPANVGRDVLVWWPVGGRPPASLDRRAAPTGPRRRALPGPGPARRPDRRAGRAVHHPAAGVAVGRPGGLAPGAGPGVDPRHRQRHRHRHAAAGAVGPRHRRPADRL